MTNILLITTDQWRGDCLSVLGRDYAQKLLSWRMHHDERGLTGMCLGPGGVTTRWEPRR